MDVAADLTEAKNFRQVSPVLCTCGQPSEAQLAAARAAGVDVVINLALHDDPRYSLPDERATVEALGMTYIHIPVQFGAPTGHDLQAFCEAMDAHEQRSILVHCAANFRVSAFLGLYQAIRHHEPRDVAFSMMHTVWQPDAVWARFISDMLAKRGR